MKAKTVMLFYGNENRRYKITLIPLMLEFLLFHKKKECEHYETHN